MQSQRSVCLVRPEDRASHGAERSLCSTSGLPFGFRAPVRTSAGTELRSSPCDFTQCTICLYDEHELSRSTSTGEYIRFQLPVTYSAATCEFEMFGSFCSFECARAFLMQRHQRPLIDQERVLPLLALYARRVLGKDYRIFSGQTSNRPHKFALQRYGGPMSIKDFRSEWCNSIRHVVYRMLPSAPRYRQVQVIVDEYVYPTGNRGGVQSTGGLCERCNELPVASKGAVVAASTSASASVNTRAEFVIQTQTQTQTQTPYPSLNFAPRRMPVHMRKQSLVALIRS